MRFYIGITDEEWFRFLSARPEIDEVNFWQPSGNRTFKSLSVGEPFLFKLHSPNNYIVGGGFFAHYSQCPVELAWEAFGEKNGASSLPEMRSRLAKYRRVTEDRRANYVIGCIILSDPFFLPTEQWIPQPADFSKNLVQGRSYDASSGTGQQTWEAVLQHLEANVRQPREVNGPIWGRPALVRQRLGQGTFRMLITDTYERRCAITREKALPVLQAAHIRPVRDRGTHRIDNGVLLRSDLHALFDAGYVTITPQYHVRVSHKLKDDFDNGEHYHQLDRSEIWIPKSSEDRPNREFLEWHADTTFKG